MIETSQGVAFEIDVKSPKAAEAVTPERFQRYATGEKPLPRLLFSSRDAALVPESPVKAIAEKARANNEKKRDVAQRVKQEQDDLISSKRSSLDKELERAIEKKNSTLADKKTKAGKHFEEVLAKVDDLQRQKADAAAEQQRRIEEALALKGACQEANVSERKSKAVQHNELVAKKLQEHSQSVQQRVEKLREQLEAAAEAQSETAERKSKAGRHNELVAKKVQEHSQTLQQRADQLREQLERKSQRQAIRRPSFSASGTPKAGTSQLSELTGEGDGSSSVSA